MYSASNLVAVIGGQGQLGRDLVAELGSRCVSAPTHEEVDITERSQVAQWLDRVRPGCVVTTAAYHDVDRCEEDARRALDVNALGAWNLASETARTGARLVFVSTDYVFSGAKGAPYVESDLPEPLNVYGASKAAGEALVRATNPDSLVVRTSALYGLNPCRGKPGGRNFVELMLKLAAERGEVRVVDDEATSPTFTGHLAPALRHLLDTDSRGIAHLAAAGHCTWYEFACAIFEESKNTAVVERALSSEFPKKARRPAFSALGSERLATKGGAPLPPWREGLREYLRARASRPVLSR